MNVLVAIHHPVIAWTIPETHVDTLRRRFPHITFLHSRDRESDHAMAADADVAFALSLSKDAMTRASFAGADNAMVARARGVKSPSTMR